MSKNIRLVEFSDDEIYTIEKSAEGTNAYYCDYCNVAGYRPNYASCLRRIKDAEKGELSTVEASCGTAIKRGICPSLELQREEVKAGKALYYLNRIKMRQNQHDNADVMGIRLGSTVAGKINGNFSKVISTSTPAKESETPSFADAINKKLKSLRDGDISTSTEDVVNLSQSKVTSDLVSKPINTEGLSLLEIARLRKQQTINA
jgi:hypothetical protein